MTFSKRQIEIIKAATELIHDGGIQEATTKNIAKKMAFTEPSIYRHFENKTHILQSIILHYRSQMKEKMELIDNRCQNAREVLQEMLRIQFKHFSNFPAIATVIFSEGSFQNDKRLSRTVAHVVQAKKKMLKQIIEKGQLEGSIRKDLTSEDIAVLYIGSMRFTMLDWRLNEYQFSLVSKGEELIVAMNKWI